jgi:hypothetical protein
MLTVILPNDILMSLCREYHDTVNVNTFVDVVVNVVVSFCLVSFY